jgi:hypothetical protein
VVVEVGDWQRLAGSAFLGAVSSAFAFLEGQSVNAGSAHDGGDGLADSAGPLTGERFGDGTDWC